MYVNEYTAVNWPMYFYEISSTGELYYYTNDGDSFVMAEFDEIFEQRQSRNNRYGTNESVIVSSEPIPALTDPEVPVSMPFTDVTLNDWFHDVGEGVWYMDAILWAESTEVVVTGYFNGNFGPADKINREQIALMMYRYAQYQNYDTEVRAEFDQYQDASQVSDFASDALQWVVGNGIVTGKDNQTKLDPKGNAARSECAAILMRFMKKYIDI